MDKRVKRLLDEHINAAMYDAANDDWFDAGIDLVKRDGRILFDDGMVYRLTLVRVDD
jgi:hypothetical protein